MPDNSELAMLKEESFGILRITLGSIHVGVHWFIRFVPGDLVEIISPFERKVVQLGDLSRIY